MGRERRGRRNISWLYTSVCLALLCITVFETLKFGFGPVGLGDVGDSISVVRRQAANGTDTTTTPTSTPDTTSAAPATTSTPDPTTSAAPATTTPTSDPATTSAPADTGSGSTGSDGSTGATTVVTDTTTTPAAAAPAAGATSGSTSSGSGSSSNSGTDSGSSDSGSSDSGTSGSSGSGSSGPTGTGSSDNGSTGSSSGTSAGTGSSSGTTGGDTSGSGSSSGSGDTGSGNAGSGSDSGSDLGSGAASASGAPAATNAPAATGAGASAAGSGAATAPAAGATVVSTSLGKPVPLRPTTMTSSEAKTLITTGSDGKPTPTTSHFLSTFVTTPYSTPSSVITSTAAAGAGSTSSPKAGASDQKASSGGISTGGKAAIGVIVPLLAILAGVAIAVYLMRKHKKQDADAEKSSKPAISGPYSASSSLDPLKRFSSLKVQDIEHPDHEPINQPALPQLRTPAMSIYEGAERFAGTGAAGRAGAALAASMASKGPPSVGDMSTATTLAPAGLMRTASTHSDISSVSAYSRESRYSQYSHYSQHDGVRSRSPSPPPPLPEIPIQQSNFLDLNSSNTAGLSTPSHPYDALVGDARLSTQRESKAFDEVSAISALSFASDHPSQSPSKAPSISGVSLLDPRDAPELPANRPESEYSTRDSKHLSTMSHISDASATDARATQLFYPFGDQVMTPGGRIVPTPVGLNPKNINPGLGGMRSDGSKSNNVTRKPSLNRPSTAGAPTLPQLPEVQEDNGFAFDFGDAVKPLSPVEETTPSVQASGPTRPRAPTPEPMPTPRPSEDSTRPGMRTRAPSVGYRRYRPNNL